MTTDPAHDASAPEQPIRGGSAPAAAAATPPHERAEPAPIADLMSLTPGGTAILETFAPAVRARVAALGLQPGQVVQCVAAGSAGVRLQTRTDEELMVPDEVAQRILVRPVEQPFAHGRAVAARDREVRISRGDERAG